jgi:hypothetical protein
VYPITRCLAIGRSLSVTEPEGIVTPLVERLQWVISITANTALGRLLMVGLARIIRGVTGG